MWLNSHNWFVRYQANKLDHVHITHAQTAEVCGYWKFTSTDYLHPQSIHRRIIRNHKWYSFHVCRLSASTASAGL